MPEAGRGAVRDGKRAAEHAAQGDSRGPVGKLPIDWMLAILRDPDAEQSRRDRAAEVAAPYCHPRLSCGLDEQVNGRDNGAGDINITQIFAVPRGARIDVNPARS